MTTYRKLASSSIAAIERALELRRQRLLDGDKGDFGHDDHMTSEDLSEGGDDQDDLDLYTEKTAPEEFFSHEQDMIDKLLSSIRIVKENDEKLHIFLEQVVKPLTDEGKNLLIFTEYRATQTYIETALREKFSEIGDVVLINGSMTLDQKLGAIDAFNHTSQFLISTEAGGEGLNLHESCHVMANYDLPWNPARLVQRIGRLYRYGQEFPVVVFNLHAKDGFDNFMIDLMMQRVAQIVQDMAPIGADFHDRLHSEIIGDILDNLDMSSILQSTMEMQVERTREQINEAVERARQAKMLHDDIFSYVSGYDPGGLQGTLGFTMQHVDLFVQGMLRHSGVSIDAVVHGGKVLDLRLSGDMRGTFPEFGQRTVVRVTTDRKSAQRFRDVILLDFENSFFRHLIETAKSYKFDGYYAAVSSSADFSGRLAGFKLRWQNDQGVPLIEEFVVLTKSEDGKIAKNSPHLAQWLLAPMTSVQSPFEGRKERRAEYGEMIKEANRHLAVGATRFKQPNGVVALACADCKTSAG